MVDYKQCLRLRAEGVSQRGIADVLGCSRNTVAAVFASANTLGVGYGQVADLAADEVRDLLLPERVKPDSDRAVPDFEHVHRELGRASVTLLLLWNGYVANCRQSDQVPYQYSFFNEQYRRWVRSTGATMRIARDPGEQLEVDSAGDTMSFIDPVTGELVKGWLFVATLAHSAYSYVEAFADMTLPSWIQAHVHALEFFGGVTRLLVPDNLRTGVSRSDRYEPVLNPAYASLAEHYGSVIIPAAWTATYDILDADVLQPIDWAQRQAGDQLTYAVAMVYDDAAQERLDPGRGRGLVWLLGRDGNDIPHDEPALAEAQQRMLRRRHDPVRVPEADRAPADLEVGDPPTS